MSNNAHDLSTRLLNALDTNYNVVDMQTVNEIISILEKFNITKELLETTRLGKHVNELRRKTSDPTLARRAKVLVKRWRDLVIPTVASPAHTGSNRSSAERSVRRHGGTPLTSPALSRQVVSPAVPSPRPPSRPAWGGYESDSQDVILVDDDGPDPPGAPPPPALLPAPPAPLHPPPPPALLAPPPPHKPLTPPVKRPPEPDPRHDDKKAKRDKKPKKPRGHGRAGSGTEATDEPASTTWGVRNGTHATPTAVATHDNTPSVPNAHATPNAYALNAHRTHARTHSGARRRNGERRKGQLDPYTALVNRIPKAGDKKVKTTKELLEQIQSRGNMLPVSPASPASPGSPDVMLIGPDPFPKTESPLRNGSSEPRPLPPLPPPSPPARVPLPPLEDERDRPECTCGEGEEDEACPAAVRMRVAPVHVHALHNALLPGLNGTRAPTEPHRFAVRQPQHPDYPDLFASVVPLYKYSDYADDYCVKNLSRLPLCTNIPWTEFAPSPPSPPPLPPPPSPRPYPIDEPEDSNISDEVTVKRELDELDDRPCPKVEAEMVGVPQLEPSERLKAPLLSAEEETQFNAKPKSKMEVQNDFETVEREHRTVERTKDVKLDGKTLYGLCERAVAAVPYDYSEVSSAPVVTLPEGEEAAREALASALRATEEDTDRDQLGRPPRASNFTEWHECARLGDLLALPYVVID